MATRSPEIAEALDIMGRQGITILKPMPVQDYLQAHPDMISPVSSISATVRKHFPLSIPINLELYVDPEIRDEYLTLYVCPPSYQEGLMETIEALSEQSWHSLKNAPGHFLITTEYRPSE